MHNRTNRGAARLTELQRKTRSFPHHPDFIAWRRTCAAWGVLPASQLDSALPLGEILAHAKLYSKRSTQVVAAGA